MGVEHTAAVTAGTLGPMACRAAKETTALNGKAINSRTAVVMVMSHNVLAEALEAKIAYNKTRPYKHGGKAF